MEGFNLGKAEEQKVKIEETETEEEELADPSNLELAWEVLKMARPGYCKAGNKAALAKVYLDMGEVSVKNQDYG